MKALTYHGIKDVRLENVPDPTLVEDDDVVLRVTATAICGSDLHIYRGKIPAMKDGDILGHEFAAEGRDVDLLPANLIEVFMPVHGHAGSGHFRGQTAGRP